MPVMHSHCSYCGTAYTSLPWPRTCANCGETTWLNPLPVAVVQVPVIGDDGRTGLLMVRRGEPPQVGEIAMPGGFIEEGETWQAAAVRELREETGLIATEDEVELVDVLSAPAHVVLIFGSVKPRTQADLAAFPPEAIFELSGGEVTELVVINEAQTLAFPLHTAVTARYFAETGR
jgi:ADP-ribose pyrophosphatase YjhB (NUDIX family)